MNNTSEVSWISWFCRLHGNEFFCEVADDYIRDSYNLAGLEEQVPHYRHALDIIQESEPDGALDVNCSQINLIDPNAEMLYGIIHARYILTDRGMAQMVEKYKAGNFGYCPRVCCQSERMLPVALSDTPGQTMVKCYCPKCKEVYTPKLPKHHNTDGVYFGMGFPHILFLTYPELKPKNTFKHLPRLFKVDRLPFELQRNERP